MGNSSQNSSKLTKNYKSSVKVALPDLSYINRTNKFLLLLESQDPVEISLKKKLKLYPDSSISSLPDSSIIIAGGSDSTSSLTSRVFQIFPFSRTLKILPLLPVPCKYGKFHKYQESLIYIGGICAGQENSSSLIEEGSPICQLNTEKNKWNLYVEKTRFDLEKYLKRGIFECGNEMLETETERDSKRYLKDLFGAGSAVVRDKIYLVGGRFRIEGRMVCSKGVIGVEIRENVVIKEEEFFLPVELYDVSCDVTGSIVCVAGGFLEDGSNNFSIFLIDVEGKKTSVLDVTLNLPLEPNYPIYFEEKSLICFSSLKLMFVQLEKKAFFTFSLPKKITQGCIENTLQGNSAFIEKVPSDLGIISIVSFPSKSKIQCFKCKKVMTRLRKNKENCDHCKTQSSSKLVCSACSHILCKNCSRNLLVYPSIVSRLSCSNFHSFCLTDSSGEKCVNCSDQVKSPHLFCFICEEHLCFACQVRLEATLKIYYFCMRSHLLSFVFYSREKCCLCELVPLQILSYRCENCRISLCLLCLSDEEAKKNAKIPLLTDKKTQKNRSPADQTDLKYVGRFSTSLDDIKKKIIQKPVRGQLCPLILSQFVERIPDNRRSDSAKLPLFSRKLSVEEKTRKISKGEVLSNTLKYPQEHSANIYLESLDPEEKLLNKSMKSDFLIRSDLEIFSINENSSLQLEPNNKNIEEESVKYFNIDQEMIALKKEEKKLKKKKKEIPENRRGREKQKFSFNEQLNDCEVDLEDEFKAGFNLGVSEENFEQDRQEFDIIKKDLSVVLEEDKGISVSPIIFTTLGDDTEQIAPVIEENEALNKLRALKAKLNLLTELSSSESGEFNGFILKNLSNIEDFSEDSISDAKIDFDIKQNPEKSNENSKSCSREESEKSNENSSKESESFYGLNFNET